MPPRTFTSLSILYPLAGFKSFLSAVQHNRVYAMKNAEARGANAERIMQCVPLYETIALTIHYAGAQMSSFVGMLPVQSVIRLRFI